MYFISRSDARPELVALAEAKDSKDENAKAFVGSNTL